jgi:hypothetical protein
MVGYRSDNEQDIGLARRRRDKKPKPVHVVIGIIKKFDLVKTGSTTAGIYHTDMQRSLERLRESL